MAVNSIKSIQGNLSMSMSMNRHNAKLLVKAGTVTALLSALSTSNLTYSGPSPHWYHLVFVLRWTMTTLTAADSSLDPVVTVADRSVTLSTDLHHVAELCSHQETAIEISNVAGELALLSTTLHQLRKAMLTNDKYTAAFNQDLQEITTELTFLLDEIAECCSEMQKTDHNNSAAAWFFKKGRVGKLEKHLEALKTTLVVMRSVLHHGKEYGQEE